MTNVPAQNSALVQLRPAVLLAVIASFGFLALFPFHFLYHYLASIGIIQTFLGGGFGIWTIVVVALGLPLFFLVQHNLGRAAGPYLAMVYAFIAYVLFWIALHYFRQDNSLLFQTATEQLVITLVSWSALFLLGVFLPQENAGFRRVLAVAWALSVILTLLSFDRSYLILDLSNGDENIASYKELARSVCYASLVFALGFRNRAYRLGIGAVSALTLFAIGSRSELLGFMIAIVIVEAMFSRRSIAGYVLIGAVFLVAFFFASENLAFLEQSRFGTLLNLDNDQSWIRRDALNSFAWSQIQTEPVFGIYGGHILAGDESSYAHNALSAWVSLGLMGFVLYIIPTAYCTWVCARASWRTPNSPGWGLALAVNVISLIFIAASHGLFWTLPALGWGLALRAKVLQEKAHSRARITERQVMRPGRSTGASSGGQMIGR